MVKIYLIHHIDDTHTRWYYTYGKPTSITDARLTAIRLLRTHYDKGKVGIYKSELDIRFNEPVEVIHYNNGDYFTKRLSKRDSKIDFDTGEIVRG